MNGTLRANGTDGFPRIDRQPLVVRTDDTSPTLMAKAQRNEPTEESFVIYDVEQVANTMLGHRGKDGGGISPDETLVPFSIVPESGQGADLRATQVDTSPALGAVTHGRATDRGVRLADGVRVRRLTPTECERLMGWPDGWTAPDGVRAPDSKRYAACGDGVVANVAEWIGRRILREQLA